MSGPAPCLTVAVIRPPRLAAGRTRRTGSAATGRRRPQARPGSVRGRPCSLGQRLGKRCSEPNMRISSRPSSIWRRSSGGTPSPKAGRTSRSTISRGSSRGRSGDRPRAAASARHSSSDSPRVKACSPAVSHHRPGCAPVSAIRAMARAAKSTGTLSTRVSGPAGRKGVWPPIAAPHMLCQPWNASMRPVCRVAHEHRGPHDDRVQPAAEHELLGLDLGAHVGDGGAQVRGGRRLLELAYSGHEGGADVDQAEPRLARSSSRIRLVPSTLTRRGTSGLLPNPVIAPQWTMMSVPATTSS